MKKIVLTFTCMLFVAASLFAQKLPKSVKEAKKAMNANKHAEALSLIDKALEDGTTASMAEAWSVKGEILAKLVDKDFEGINKALVSGDKYEVVDNLAGGKALEAFSKALELASGNAKDKGFKASIKGLTGLATNLNNVGLFNYNNGDFAGAFDSFNALIGCNSLLKSNGNKSIFSNPEDLTLTQYYAGLAAYQSKQTDKALPIFESLVEANFNKPLPYQEVFNAYIDSDPDKAMGILAKGKENCGDEPDALKAFLFAEINHYLKNGEYAKLEGHLEKAIAAEPENVSLHFALGSVYDQLYQTAQKEGRTADAEKNFGKSVEFYEKTFKMDPTFSDAPFNIGALIFNKAVFMNEEIKKYDDDMSSAGIKKWEELKETQKGMMAKAKPHFEQTLQIDAEHRGALKAMMQIAAYNNDQAGIAKYKKLLGEE